MSVPTFQAVGTAVGGTGNITVAWPTHAIGDVAFLLVESANETVVLGTPNGFALVDTSGFGTAGASSAERMTLFWCLATTSSMASPVVTDPGDHAYGVIITFRGCPPSGAPWDGYTISQKTTSSLSSTWPTTGVTQTGGRVVLFCTSGAGNFGAQYTTAVNAALTGITEHFDAGSNGTGNNGHIAIDSGTYVGTTGLTGSSTSTITDDFAGDMVEVNMTMVLRNSPAQQLVVPQVRSNQSLPRSAYR